MKTNEFHSVQRFRKGTLFCSRYEIIRRIGFGSVGEIYEVKDRELGEQTVALKFLHHFLNDDSASLQRFQNEVFIARQLTHPNIARVYDFGCVDNIHFITLEYVSGCNLSEIAASYISRRLPAQEALYLLLQIAEGLAFAHRKNVIHRDLKPANIIVEKTGLAKIADFGLAFSIETDHGLTRTGEMIGSPAYLAPEQFVEAKADARADVYAFGILAFELLTGELPFDSKSYYELAQQHLRQEFPREQLEALGISPGLVEIVTRCCAKRSEDRPCDAGALLESLSQEGSGNETTGVRLKTIVSQRRQDSRITTGAEAGRLQFWYLSSMLALLIFVVSDKSTVRRVAESLVQIERHTGLPTAFLHQYIFYSSSNLQDVNELLRLASSESSSRAGGNGDVRIFLEGGINLMQRIPDGTNDTVLHKLVGDFTAKSSAIIEHAKLTHTLDQRNNKGETPLMRAVKLGDTMSVSYLTRGTARIERIKDLGKGAKQHKDESAIYLNTPTHLYNKLQGSVVFGADQTIADNDGNYPLHVAVGAGDPGIVKILVSPKYLSPRLPPTTLGPKGNTALHLAIGLEHEEIAEYLLANGYSANLRDAKGRTPLMLALSRKATAGSKKMVTLLLQNGSSTEPRDNYGRTAYDYALKHSRVEELP